jgi:putative transposase
VFLVIGATPLKDACNGYGLDLRYERHGNRDSVERFFRKENSELTVSQTV